MKRIDVVVDQWYAHYGGPFQALMVLHDGGIHGKHADGGYCDVRAQDLEPLDNDAYPFSMVDTDGRRQCPVCEATVAPDEYARHWITEHADITDPEAYVAAL